MATNKELLSKGIKKLAWALPAFFIGPTIVHFAFINQLQPTYYLILGFGIAICIAGIIMLFLGIKTMMKSLFND